MTRWLLAISLALAVAPAIAHGQGAPSVQVRTQAAQVDVSRLERAVTVATGNRNSLNTQYQAQLKAVDRLKQQRASWRRDRDLKDALTAAQATASKVSAAASELGRATAQLTTARRTLLAAIDRELALAPNATRTVELNRQRQQLAPAPAKKVVAKIVLPDMQIDPLADPEELDAQAAEFVRAEQELTRQAIVIDQQAKDLDQAAKMRKQHERATELARRDDDQPQRNARVSSGGRTLSGADAENSPSPDDSGGEAPSGDPSTGGIDGAGGGGGAGAGFEADTSLVLSNVVDAATIETLSRASRSSDPAVRAQAAKRASDAVKLRLEQLRKKRLEIEAAAKARRR